MLSRVRPGLHILIFGLINFRVFCSAESPDTSDSNPQNQFIDRTLLELGTKAVLDEFLKETSS